MAPNNVVEWMGQHHPTTFCDGFPSLQTCEALHCDVKKQDACLILVGLNLFGTLSEFL
jgi:hypothetical protein